MAQQLGNGLHLVIISHPERGPCYDGPLPEECGGRGSADGKCSKYGDQQRRAEALDTRQGPVRLQARTPSVRPSIDRSGWGVGVGARMKNQGCFSWKVTLLVGRRNRTSIPGCRATTKFGAHNLLLIKMRCVKRDEQLSRGVDR